MYRNLFIAWYCLGVLALCLVTFLILLPFIGAMRATGSFGFLGFIGFLPILGFIFFRTEKADERDMLFLQRALFCGFCFGFSSMGPIVATLGLAYHEANSISLNLLSLPLHGGLFIGIFSFAVMLLYSYYRGGHIEHGGQPHE